MIPDTAEGLLRLIDRARIERGHVEDALAAGGWQWSRRVSLWVDDMVIEEEGRAA